MNEMMLPIDMIHQSFRYVLGRSSYAVSSWCDWIILNWNRIPKEERNLLILELERTFRQDDIDREGIKFVKALGHDCDRRQWERVRELYNERII